MKDHMLLFLSENLGRKKQNYPNLSMLSVVIPSYCRQDFIIRQCAYWHGLGASIIIVDGSPKPLASNVQQIIADLSDITYVHSTAVLVDRLKHAATLIKTPYTVLCGDDEFLLEGGLSRAISLLENDLDLVACVGQSLRFYQSNDGSKCNYGTGYDTYRYEIKHDTIQERLNASVKNYNAATCYAVTRSSVWRKSWGNLHQYSSGHIMELEHALTTYIWGKLASVDEVYWMRSEENPPNETTDVKRLPTSEWWTSDEFKTERTNFITELGEEMVNAQKIARLSAEDLVVKVVDIFLHDQKYPSNSSFRQRCRQFVVNTLKEWMPKVLVGYLIKLRSRLWPIVPETGNLGNLVDLKATKNSLPFLLNDELVNDLSAMEKLIADFYKARSDKFE